MKKIIAIRLQLKKLYSKDLSDTLLPHHYPLSSMERPFKDIRPIGPFGVDAEMTKDGLGVNLGFTIDENVDNRVIIESKLANNERTEIGTEIVNIIKETVNDSVQSIDTFTYFDTESSDEVVEMYIRTFRGSMLSQYIQEMEDKIKMVDDIELEYMNIMTPKELDAIVENSAYFQ